CGGMSLVALTDCGRRISPKFDDAITARYDFALPIVCSFCPEVFTEAYTLSSHISQKHKHTVESLEKKLAGAIEQNPRKKFYYEPFMCSKCHNTFKSMPQFAQHIHSRIQRGQACNGDVKILKFIKEESAFKSNVPASLKTKTAGAPIEKESSDPPENQTRKLTFDGTYSKEIKAEYMGMTMEAFENEIQKEIKYEPIDADELRVTDHLKKKPNDTPVLSYEHPYIPREMRARMDREKEHSDQLRAPYADHDQVVVKEEPIDEYFEGRTAAAAAA
ncbi:hypothetical protein PFISCL1PPCAC_26602, partial [Pristionchus fissidentatus]